MVALASPSPLPALARTRELAPITDILNGLPPTPEKVHFCYEAVKRTLSALLNKQYSLFDAHTTTNCCQGIALLAQEQIIASREEDLEQLLVQVTNHILTRTEDPLWEITRSLIQLTHLHILYQICDVQLKTLRTDYRKLAEIAPGDGTFFSKLARALQKHYGNLVAHRYEQYLHQISGQVQTCGVPIELWGKYTSYNYLRVDNRNLYYAASLYAMQVVLGYQIHSKYNIAMINDIQDMTGKMIRYVQVLKGNGQDGFIKLDLNKQLEKSQCDEPVIVFLACAKTENPDKISAELDEWLSDFPNLVLAHELTYPQFPKANEQFESRPIIPEEKILQDLMIERAKIEGVSAKDPSFCCFNHIYTASLYQILHESQPDQFSLRILASITEDNF